MIKFIWRQMSVILVDIRPLIHLSIVRLSIKMVKWNVAAAGGGGIFS